MFSEGMGRDQWYEVGYKDDVWNLFFFQQGCKLPTNFLSVFDHFVGLRLKGLNIF